MLGPLGIEYGGTGSSDLKELSDLIGQLDVDEAVVEFDYQDFVATLGSWKKNTGTLNTNAPQIYTLNDQFTITRGQPFISEYDGGTYKYLKIEPGLYQITQKIYVDIKTIFGPSSTFGRYFYFCLLSGLAKSFNTANSYPTVTESPYNNKVAGNPTASYTNITSLCCSANNFTVGVNTTYPMNFPNSVGQYETNDSITVYLFSNTLTENIYLTPFNYLSYNTKYTEVPTSGDVSVRVVYKIKKIA